MLFNAIGWTMIHSLWQCLGLLGVLRLVLGFVDLRRSRVRYDLALGVLGLALFGVLGTFVWEWRAFTEVPVAAGGVAVRPAVDVVGGVMVESGSSRLTVLAWLAKMCPVLTMGWIVGVLFYTGRLVLSGMALRRLRRLTGVSDVAAEAMVEGLRVRMGVVRPVRLLITDGVAEPMTFGFLRAVVVLPVSYVSQVPADQLEMILAHEMAHIRRRDYVVNLMQHVFDVLLFFNPFFRLISEMVREEREYCCDDRAAVVGGDERRMAVALTNLGLVKRGLALGLTAASTKRRFYRRVMRLIEPAERPGLSVRGALLGMLGALAVVAVLTQCSRSAIAQDVLPTAEDKVMEVLSDNQAGYKELVYHYTKGRAEHELFLVKTQDERKAVYAYVDGIQLNGDELSKAMEVLKKRRGVPVVLLLAKGDPDTVYKIGETHGDSLIVRKVRADSTREVRLAMMEYRLEARNIPLEVEQHALLSRIVTNHVYTAGDRRQLNELISKRQALSPAVNVEGRQ